jgi:hypothetical protein
VKSLNTSLGRLPAYTFSSGGDNATIALWAPSDGSAYNSSNRFFSPQAGIHGPFKPEVPMDSVRRPSRAVTKPSRGPFRERYGDQGRPSLSVVSLHRFRQRVRVGFGEEPCLGITGDIHRKPGVLPGD